MSDKQNQNEAACCGSALTAELGTPLAEVTDTEKLQLLVERLWSIIDDIDAYSDMVKGDNALYRTLVERKQWTRHQIVTSDGYGLFVCGPNA